MNKKISFVFLVLLCSLNLTIFASREAQCVNYSNKNGSLLVTVAKNGTKTYEVTIKSYASVDLEVTAFSISNDKFTFNSPVERVIGKRGKITVIVTCTAQKLIPLSESDISVYAKECH